MTTLTREQALQVQEAVKCKELPQTESEAISLLLADHDVWEKHSLTQLVTENAALRQERDALKGQVEALRAELAEAKCGEALCGHDHSTQYWELRANKAEGLANDAQEAIGHYQAQLQQAQQRYNDLIMQVGKKFPGETRHDTAKRYIQQAERPSSDTAHTALQEASHE